MRLKDVADVGLGGQDYSINAQFNGSPASGIAIKLATGANALDTAKAIRQTIANLEPFMPQGMKVVYPYDTTPVVSASIHEVVKTLGEAILLVFLVMYLFLQNFRATLIPTIAVPVVLLGTFGVLAAFGFSINTPDHVRHGAGHRLAGGRRHRGGGERRAGDGRGRPVAKGGGAQVHGPDPGRAGRYRHGALGGIPADGVLRRLHRGDLPAVLHHHRVGHGPLGDRGADPHPGALRDHKPIEKGDHGEHKGGFFGWFNRMFLSTTHGYERGVASILKHRAPYLLIYVVIVAG